MAGWKKMAELLKRQDELREEKARRSHERRDYNRAKQHSHQADTVLKKVLVG